VAIEGAQPFRGWWDDPQTWADDPDGCALGLDARRIDVDVCDNRTQPHVNNVHPCLQSHVHDNEVKTACDEMQRPKGTRRSLVA
jgi:hypothetical protein